MIINLIEFLKARPQLLRRAGYAIVALVVVWSLIVIDSQNVENPLEKIPAFWSLFTIVSALALVILARVWGNTGIETSEDYYDR